MNLDVNGDSLTGVNLLNRKLVENNDKEIFQAYRRFCM